MLNNFTDTVKTRFQTSMEINESSNFSKKDIWCKILCSTKYQNLMTSWHRKFQAWKKYGTVKSWWFIMAEPPWADSESYMRRLYKPGIFWLFEIFYESCFLIWNINKLFFCIVGRSSLFSSVFCFSYFILSELYD